MRKKYIIIISISFASIFVTTSNVFAAHMYISSPPSASSNREPLVVSVILDSDNSSIGGVGGELSFSSELFDVQSITTQNGVISLWAVEPHVSNEKNIDRRTRINFEGIIPGGFSGVYSAYYNELSPGVVFTVILIPKNAGKADIKLDNVALHAFDSKGTIINEQGSVVFVKIPTLSGKEKINNTPLIKIDNESLSLKIEKSELVNNGSPYIYVHEEDPARNIDHIEFAETDEYNPIYVGASSWHTSSNPYIPLYSSRTKYIHAKVVYTNNTYTYKTLPPVENSQAFRQQSRILVYILVAISLLYLYAKNFLHIIKKVRTRH